jgi:integrase
MLAATGLRRSELLALRLQDVDLTGRVLTGQEAPMKMRSDVARAGIEPATFRFSGGRSYRLSYLAGRHRVPRRRP